MLTGAQIQSIGAYVPQKRMANHEFEKIVDTSDEWIQSHTGIRYRHVASENEATSDLAVKAGMQAIKRAGITPVDIDMILVATASADHVGFPSTACLVQDKIGAKNSAAMDIVAGCTGFVYGLETAKGLISTGTFNYILLIGSEILTRIMDWDDRNTCVLFGDGAGAAVISKCNPNKGIIYSFLRSDGSGSNALSREVGGTKKPFKKGETDLKDSLIKMDGRAVYSFAVQVMVETINNILINNNITISDIKYIVPHQANERIIEAAARRSKIPRQKFFINIAEFANTSAATIPIALNQLYQEKELSPDDLIITVGFGAGLTFGGNLIKW